MYIMVHDVNFLKNKLEKNKNSGHAILSLCVVKKKESMTPLSRKKLKKIV